MASPAPVVHVALAAPAALEVSAEAAAPGGQAASAGAEEASAGAVAAALAEAPGAPATVQASFRQHR